MMQKVIVCDLNRCIGCLTCSVACKLENNVPIGLSCIDVIRMGPNPKYEGARFPEVEMYFLPLMCQHCSDPGCIAVCPTEASYKAADGTVLIDREKCTGCRLCIEACPYSLCHYNERENVAEKCTLCHHLVADGKEPMCVSQCAGRALIFGDLDDPKSAASRAVAAAGKDVHHLPDTGNHPMFRYILRKATWRGYFPLSKSLEAIK
ncbi:MAG: 4Fe-4S dicluster domain-containing protein [Pseudomonadota bacterium]